MKLRLLCTEGTKGSTSLKLLANTLTQKLGYKVWRSRKPHAKRNNLKYGHSVNKLDQYKWFKEQGLSALEFTEDAQVAASWAADGHVVFGRTLLNSSCGKGIVVIEPPVNPELEWVLPLCPVYTKYKKKKREFRVHIFQNTVVAVTEKRRRAGFEGTRDTRVRNLANGYVFCQTVMDEPEGLRSLAQAAAAVSPSDFRGVDIGYNERNNDLFIIEVNSAPGIQGSNIDAYVNAIT